MCTYGVGRMEMYLREVHMGYISGVHMGYISGVQIGYNWGTFGYI